MHTKTRTTITVDALAALFPHQVTTAADLITLGLPHEELVERCLSTEWQHLLPGVLLLSRKPPTRLQRVQAALRYAGPGALLTGIDALHLHGLRTVPTEGPILVLTARPVEPADGLRALRPRTRVDPVLRMGFPTAPLLRAVVDTTRTVTDPHALRAVLTEAVRRGVPVQELTRALSTRGDPIKQILATLPPRQALLSRQATQRHSPSATPPTPKSTPTPAPTPSQTPLHTSPTPPCTSPTAPTHPLSKLRSSEYGHQRPAPPTSATPHLRWVDS